MTNHETKPEAVLRLVRAYQDGAQFYRKRDGSLIAEYPGTVAHDFDMVGARKARDLFAAEHPEFIASADDLSDLEAEALELSEEG